MSRTLSHAGLPVLKALKCQSSRKCVSIHPFHTDSISVSLMFNGASCVYYDLIIPNLKPTPQPLKTFIIYRRKEEKKKTNSAAARLKCAFFTAVSSPVLISLCVCTPWRVIPGWEMLTVFAAGYILWSFFFLFFFLSWNVVGSIPTSEARLPCQLSSTHVCFIFDRQCR